jgi:hypothetical protein
MWHKPKPTPEKRQSAAVIREEISRLRASRETFGKFNERDPFDTLHPSSHADGRTL